jgi:hypothetical protein
MSSHRVLCDPDSEVDSGESADGTETRCPAEKPGTLKVSIVDADTGRAADAIVVDTAGTTPGTQTSNAKGVALFTGLVAGPYTAKTNSPCVATASGSATVPAGKTATIKLRVQHTHAVLRIESLAYQGHNPVDNDTLGEFTAPEWKRGRVPAGFPVSYARKTKVAFEAEFTVTTAPCRTEAVDVRAKATFGKAKLTWEGTVNVNPGDATVKLVLTSKQKLADRVDAFDANDITWDFKPANAAWAAAGASRNTLYVTLASPTGGVTNHWTPLDISCRAGAGSNGEDKLVKKSFERFKASVGAGNGIPRQRDGVLLSYYLNGANTGNIFSCAALLAAGDGSGRCGSWAKLMVNMHKQHGIASSKVVGVVPRSAPVLIVKNGSFMGAGSRAAPFTHVGTTEFVKTDGIPGQNAKNPQFLFGDHALVEHKTGIYDPSYGVGPIAKDRMRLWEDGGIAGLASGHKVETYKGLTHLTGTECSPGFVHHTVVAGETMAKIAKRYGVTSAAVLYNHAYNAALQVLRSTPAAVTTGDDVVVPRDIASKLTVLKFHP